MNIHKPSHPGKNKSRGQPSGARFIIAISVVVLLMLAMLTAAVLAGGQMIYWEVIASGGLSDTSGTYVLKSTIGEVIVGGDRDDSLIVEHGFWQACCNVPGDANNDGGCNVGDITYLINYVYKGGPPPPCMNEGDANADCSVDVGDAVYLTNYVFKGGPPPKCGCVDFL
jgi:hypothetical protein